MALNPTYMYSAGNWAHKDFIITENAFLPIMAPGIK